MLNQACIGFPRNAFGVRGVRHVLERSVNLALLHLFAHSFVDRVLTSLVQGLSSLKPCQ